jgi:hypothetical protein
LKISQPTNAAINTIHKPPTWYVFFKLFGRAYKKAIPAKQVINKVVKGVNILLFN